MMKYPKRGKYLDYNFQLNTVYVERYMYIGVIASEDVLIVSDEETAVSQQYLYYEIHIKINIS